MKDKIRAEMYIDQLVRLTRGSENIIIYNQVEIDK